MPDPVDSSRDFVLLGNLPCLDLVNTRPLRHGTTEELLSTFADLVAWAESAGVLTAAEASAAEKKWQGTAQGRRVLERAREFREEFRAAVDRLAGGKPPTDAVVRSVNSLLRRRPVFSELVPQGHGWRTVQRPVTADAMHLLVPVAESAAWLIEHGDPSLLRKCENPACVLYFYDITKNKRRRWCSMDGCGSRAKAAAYYQRNK